MVALLKRGRVVAWFRVSVVLSRVCVYISLQLHVPGAHFPLKLTCFWTAVDEIFPTPLVGSDPLLGVE